jgi:hypothetical protein
VTALRGEGVVKVFEHSERPSGASKWMSQAGRKVVAIEVLGLLNSTHRHAARA